jgi:D-glycero-beta-D-manno-heptose-7-phosphate kinase
MRLRESCFHFMPKASSKSPKSAGSTLQQRLLRTIDSFSRLSIVVMGDLVADEFVFGEIARVSREAPVLILKHRDRTVVPGGAGNAVYNLADLGVDVLPIGVVGDDEPGKLLLRAFRQKRIGTSGILKLRGYSTVTKTRVLAGHTHTSRQQVVRIDREPDATLDSHSTRELLLYASGYSRAADALLISDYGYGAATPEMVKVLRTRRKFSNVPVTLDSRYRMLQFAGGVTAATPNEPEVEEALRVRFNGASDQVFNAGSALLRKMGLQSLLITRGKDGMICFDRRTKPEEIPISGGDQVVDVTGAGDTVIATYTAALAAGADSCDAARLANYAGGIVVMKRGTATVMADELRKVVLANE